MSFKNHRLRQNSGCSNDLSPRLTFGKDEQTNGFNITSNTRGFPVIPQQNKNQNGNSHNNTQFHLYRSKKKFFLAKKINNSTYQEVTNQSSINISQRPLETVLNQTCIKKISTNESPSLSPRNSVSNSLEKTNQIDTNTQGVHQSTEYKVTTQNHVQESLTAREMKNDITLPQINDASLRKSLTQRTMPTSTIQNIFNTKSLNINHKGPRYDEQGQIITRSLVGKPDWFLKKDEHILDKEKLNLIAGNKQNNQVKKHGSYSTISLKKSENKSKTKWKNMTNKISKRQLLDQIDLIRDRLKKNKKDEDKDLNSMQIDQKTQQTRDQRIMEKHEQNEHLWQKFIQKSSNDLSRDYVYSNLVKNLFNL